MEKNERSYYNYLVRLVRTPESKRYTLLLEHLWRKEYYSILPNDQNRAKDGLFLRREVNEGQDFGPCRVLEMLIALSRRMEFQLYGTDYDKTYKDLFWELVYNLDLIKFDNLEAAKDAMYLEIDRILTNWIERRYSPDGYGGVFPLNKWKKNDDKQQEVKIWYQMMLYLSENYAI